MEKHRVQKGSQTEQEYLIAGHYTPPEVLTELFRLAGEHGSRQGMNRRAFIKSQMGLAASFLALNSVFGPFFSVTEAEAADPETARSSIENFFREVFEQSQTKAAVLSNAPMMTKMHGF